MKTFFFQNEFDLKLTFNGISKELKDFARCKLEKIKQFEFVMKKGSNTKTKIGKHFFNSLRFIIILIK